MRKSVRFLSSSFGVLVFVLVSCSSIQKPLGATAARDSEPVLLAAMSPILKDARFAPEQLVIVHAETLDAEFLAEQPKPRRVPRSMWRALIERNGKSTTLDFGFSADKRILVKMAVELRQEVKRDASSRSPDAAWLAFYKRFPSARGTVSLSLPSYSRDGNQALVYVLWQGGVTAMEGYAVLLSRSTNGWNVILSELLAIA